MLQFFLKSYFSQLKRKYNREKQKSETKYGFICHMKAMFVYGLTDMVATDFVTINDSYVY